MAAEDEDDFAETITRRVQRSHETATDFVLDLLPLMQQYGAYTPEQQARRMYRNLRPEYRRHIGRDDFTTLPELLKLAAAQDKLTAEEKAAKPERQLERSTG